jgi:hypothetical protein
MRSTNTVAPAGGFTVVTEATVETRTCDAMPGTVSWQPASSPTTTSPASGRLFEESVVRSPPLLQKIVTSSSRPLFALTEDIVVFLFVESLGRGDSRRYPRKTRRFDASDGNLKCSFLL